MNEQSPRLELHFIVDEPEQDQIPSIEAASVAYLREHPEGAYYYPVMNDDETAVEMIRVGNMNVGTLAYPEMQRLIELRQVEMAAHLSQQGLYRTAKSFVGTASTNVLLDA